MAGNFSIIFHLVLCVLCCVCFACLSFVDVCLVVCGSRFNSFFECFFAVFGRFLLVVVQCLAVFGLFETFLGICWVAFQAVFRHEFVLLVPG